MGLSGLSGLSGLTPLVGGGSTLINGLAGYWPMDEANGNAIATISGKNLVASASNPGADTGLLYPTARTFDNGVNAQGFTYPHDSLFHFGDTNWTVAVWVYVTAWPSGAGLDLYHYILNSGEAWSGGFDLALNSAHVPFAVWYGADATELLLHCADAIPALNGWALIGGQWDADTSHGRIRVNANAWTEIDESGSRTDCAASKIFRVGFRLDTFYYWAGRMGPLMLWNKLLTVGEWTELYNGGAGKAYPF